MDEDFENDCTWRVKIWPSGRVSTMFYITECGEEVAMPDKAKYCHRCGKRILLMDLEFVKEFVYENA
jgi:DNA-directed RNA polymerase subunit RPC12/RpoP